jgi:ketosteroid isomerase-like protein
MASRARSLSGILAACVAATITGTSCGTGGPDPLTQRDRTSPDLEQFLRTYFSSWSAGDMAAYADHFHPDATIVAIGDGRVTSSLRRDRFVAGQADLRARSPNQARERMLSFTAREDATAATVVAQWELTGSSRDPTGVILGVNRFTLMRDERGAWRIIALVFYARA